MKPMTWISQKLLELKLLRKLSHITCQDYMIIF